jgi:hypothetical protein
LKTATVRRLTAVFKGSVIRTNAKRARNAPVKTTVDKVFSVASAGCGVAAAPQLNALRQVLRQALRPA